MRTLTIAGGTLVAVILGGCGGEDRPISLDDTGAGGMSAGDSTQDIQWRDCGQLQCAEVMVPLDRNAPDGEQIPVAINRVRREPGLRSFGVLLFNPGGPGQAGKPLVATNQAVLAGFPFDVIGFDPRGTGDSASLPCSLNLDLDAALSENGVEGLIEGLKEESETCRQATGDLFDHLSSNAVVADIEQLRIALGVEKINFYGISYGTRLGALYAQTHPDRVRALVLDSPVAPTADLQGLISSQFDGTLSAHESLLAGCQEGTLECPQDAEMLFDLLLDEAEMAGERAAFIASWALLLASPPGRAALAEVLTQVGEAGMEMSEGMDAAMDAVSAPEVGGLGVTFNGAVNLVVNCADDPSPPPSQADVEDILAAYAQRSALFASRGLPAVTCSGWQVQKDPAPDIQFSPEVPPLILAGTQDPLTPLPLAEAIQEAIEGSVLLRSEHYGHGIFSFGGQCVGEPIGRYLGTLELPAPNTICPGP